MRREKTGTDRGATPKKSVRKKTLPLLFWQSIVCLLLFILLWLLPRFNAGWHRAVRESYRRAMRSSFTATPQEDYRLQSGLVLLPESMVQEAAVC